jgi:hypothetical protein
VRGLATRRRCARRARVGEATPLPRLLPAVFVNYTVIFAGKEGDDEYSVEYDCSGEGLLNNYCIHILARKPTMAPALVSRLVNASLALNLNTQSLPFNFTHQEGCW